jgi:hypothetical protein
MLECSHSFTIESPISWAFLGRGRNPENENAAPAEDRNGVKFGNADQRQQNNRTTPRLARLIFRELRNDDGHVYGMEACA